MSILVLVLSTECTQLHSFGQQGLHAKVSTTHVAFAVSRTQTYQNDLPQQLPPVHFTSLTTGQVTFKILKQCLS